MEVVSALPTQRSDSAQVVKRLDLDRVGRLLLIVAVSLASSSLAISSADGSFSVGFQSMNNLVDPILIALGLSQLSGLYFEFKRFVLRRPDSVSVVVGMWMLFVVWGVATWAVNPRPYGLFLLLRLVGIGGAIRLLGRSSVQDRVLLVRVMIVVTFIQAMVSALQLMIGGPIGLYALGEFPDPFMRSPGLSWKVPTGLAFYPYANVATALLTLALLIFVGPRQLTRVWLSLGSLASGALVGFSGSVSAVGSVVLIIVGLLLWAGGDRPRIRHGWLVIMLPFLLGASAGAASQKSVWLWKGDRTLAVESRRVSNGRGDQIRVASEIIKRSPIVGVGPGGYMRARLNDPSLDVISEDRQIVHSVPVLVAAETGVTGLALLIGVVAVTLYRRFRDAPLLFAAMSGFVAVDFMHWYRGIGLLQWGVVIGFAASGAVSRKGGPFSEITNRPILHQ
jgi:hypothetical protein